MISVAQTVGGLAVFAGLYLSVRRIMRPPTRKSLQRGDYVENGTVSASDYVMYDTDSCGQSDGADGGSSCDGGGDGGGDSGD
ncbi:MAG: hypothetical protein KBA75_06370 [Alphaproteobacteria bacterium]|nr:hypothetical protein [Alphaproteobacteria bacterium]